MFVSFAMPALSRFVFILLAVILLTTRPAIAQQSEDSKNKNRPPRFNQLGIDFLETKQHLLRGFALKSEDPILFAVDRQWLFQTFPDAKSEFQQLEQTRLSPIIDELDQRLVEWIAESSGKDDLIRFLEEERIRIRESNRLPEINNHQFLVLQFETKDVKLKVQPGSRRRVAGIAYQFGLKDVATKTISSLKSELNKISKAWADETINLSRGLPAIQLSDREWQIRKAITEFAILKKLEFQGEGDFLIDASEQPNATQLLTKMMQNSQADSISRIGRELGIPEFTTPAPKQDQWKQIVTGKADEIGCRSVLVKRIVPSSTSDQVVVEAVFLGKLDGKWETVSIKKGVARLSTQPKAEIDELKADPQIRELLETTQALGLGAQSLLDKAFRKGAASRKASQDASKKMDQIIEGNSFQLDWPLILN